MTLLEDLRRVSATSEDLGGVQTDWTGRVSGTALAHAVPSSTDEVAGVLRVCREHAVGVTVRGGGTGLVAGAVPQGTVVLSTRRLDRMGPVEDGSMTVGAGVTLAQVQDRARRHGWDYGIDFASRDSATIGGTVATDAGGVHVLAHGTTRAQVLGVEAVLADGSVVQRLGGLVKDATGYDLGHLLVGSEGTLAVVTAVRLRLVGYPGATETALVACASVQAAVDLVSHVRLRAPGLRAAELVLAAGAALVREASGLPAPVEGVDAPAYALLEAEVVTGRPGLAGTLTAGSAGSARGVLGAQVAQETGDGHRLWAYRERLPDAVAARAAEQEIDLSQVDVSLPRGRLAAFVAALPGVTGAYETHTWGHLGDGTLHVSVVGPGHEEAVLRLAAGLGGSVGAELGVGRLKRQWLHLSRSPAELAAMRAIKDALDPTGVLNPGVLLPE